MGPTAAMMGASMAISAGSQIAGGFAGLGASNTEAKMQNQQANLAMQQAQLEATQKARTVGEFQSQQAEDYASSGITLQGSPILQLDRTRTLGQQEVNAIMTRGAAQQSLLKQQAFQTQRAGRNALIGAFTGAAANQTSNLYLANRTNVFGNSATSPLYTPTVYSPSSMTPGG